VKDRRLNSNGEVEEWERPRTIPDDFIYDPETNAYYAPGEPCTSNPQEELEKLQEVIEGIRWEGPHLISVDELRAAGALDVPPAWRKSLGGQRDQRDLLSGLSGDDDPLSEKPHSPPHDRDAEAAREDEQ
jgi:hypothetical protein